MQTRKNPPAPVAPRPRIRGTLSPRWSAPVKCDVDLMQDDSKSFSYPRGWQYAG